MYSGAIEQKYLDPIVNNSSLPFLRIIPDSYIRIRITEKFLKIIELSREEPFGFEFEIRAELSRLWCLLLKETEDLRFRLPQEILPNERLKTMLTYIHEHYMERNPGYDRALRKYQRPGMHPLLNERHRQKQRRGKMLPPRTVPDIMRCGPVFLLHPVLFPCVSDPSHTDMPQMLPDPPDGIL